MSNKIKLDKSNKFKEARFTGKNIISKLKNIFNQQLTRKVGSIVMTTALAVTLFSGIGAINPQNASAATEAGIEQVANEDNYLEPIAVSAGTVVSDEDANYAKVNFDGDKTNLISIMGKTGHENIIWTDQSYGNPNQDLILDNLINSNLSTLKADENYIFITGTWDSSTYAEEFPELYGKYDGVKIAYDANQKSYTVTYDKSMYEGAMGVSLTEKEYIDPDTYEQRLIENYPVQALIYKTLDDNKIGEEIISLPASTLQSTMALNNLLMSETLSDKEILVVLGNGAPNTLDNNAGIVDASTYMAITVMNAEKGMSR